MDQRLLRDRIAAWERASLVLERERRLRVRATDTARDLTASAGLAQAALPSVGVPATSGPVEQLRWFRLVRARMPRIKLLGIRPLGMAYLNLALAVVGSIAYGHRSLRLVERAALMIWTTGGRFGERARSAKSLTGLFVMRAARPGQMALNVTKISSEG